MSAEALIRLVNRYRKTCPICGEPVRGIEVRDLGDDEPEHWIVCVNEHHTSI
jgi:hypothetical protein